MSAKYLTGDKAALEEFIDKYDVSHFEPAPLAAWTLDHESWFTDGQSVV